jgi:hypothetical protein
MKAMNDLGLTWADVCQLIENVELVQPASTGPRERRVYLSGPYSIITAPSRWEGEPALAILGVAERNREGQEMRTVVETKAPKSSKRGGAGTLIPTSFDEILQRIDEAEGWHYEREGRKHIAVYGPNGERSTIPVSSSDWRAVKNGVAHLRRIGLDVRRVPGKKAS